MATDPSFTDSLTTESIDPDDSQYKTIGGQAAKIVRRPSLLLGIPERGGFPTQRSYSSSPSTCSDVAEGRSSLDESIVKWQQDDVLSWLHEISFGEYEPLFREHAIRSGRLLLSLEEAHLKEMGVTRVGHRLEIMEAVYQLRRDAGEICRSNFVDVNSLMKQLDVARDEQYLKLYPNRIILIRHGESQGNVDNSLYEHIPDRHLELTETGRKQAYAAGVLLKELVCEESVSFYVSPFVRSRQTFECIRQGFHDEQVLHVREDPRIREQEWGNFQNPSKMQGIMKERRKVGSFYYRFPTGESGADVYDRVSTFLETLYRDMEKGGCGRNAIIVSHGLFCRLFLTRYYHWSVDKFHKLWNFKNCQFAVMQLLPSGGYRLISELKSNP